MAVPGQEPGEALAEDAGAAEGSRTFVEDAALESRVGQGAEVGPTEERVAVAGQAAVEPVAQGAGIRRRVWVR